MDEKLNIALSLIIFLVVGSVMAYSPRDVRVVREYGQFQEAFEDEEYGEMSEHLAQIARYLTWRPELWDKAGHFAQLAGEDGRARRYFERAKSRDVLSREGYLLLGEIYQEQGDSGEAIAMWSEIPESPVAAQKKARLYHQLGDYQAAIGSWEDYLSLVDAAETDVHFTLGLLLAAEDPLQALSHLEIAAPDYPQAKTLRDALTGIEDQEPAYRLVVAGQRLGSLDRWKLASHAFQEALELRPDYPQAWAYWGEALQQVPESDKDPLRALEHALELDPQSSLVNIFLGTYWQRQGEHQKALPYFERARELDPDNPDIYVELGRSLAVIGDLEGALDQFQEAVQLRPDSPDYYRLLAQFSVDFHYNVREEGLPAARQAVILSEESPPALVIMGQVMSELGDLQNAKKFYIQALEKNATFARAHLYLGITYVNLAEDDLAEGHLKAAMRFTTSPVIQEQANSILSTLSP